MKIKKILLLSTFLFAIIFITGCKKNNNDNTQSFLDPTIKINPVFEHSKIRGRITGIRGIHPRENDKPLEKEDFKKSRFYIDYDKEIKDSLADIIQVSYNGEIQPIVLDIDNKFSILNTDIYFDFNKIIKDSQTTKGEMKKQNLVSSLDFYSPFELMIYTKYSNGETVLVTKPLDTTIGFASEDYLTEKVYNNPNANMKEKNRLNKLYVNISQTGTNHPTVEYQVDDDYLYSINAILKANTPTLEDDLIKLIAITDNNEKFNSFDELKKIYNNQQLQITNLKKIKSDDTTSIQEVKYEYTSHLGEKRENNFKLTVKFDTNTYKPKLVFNEKANLIGGEINHTLEVNTTIETALNNFINSLKFIDHYEGIIPLTGENDILTKAKKVIPLDKIVFEGDNLKTYQIDNINLVGSDKNKPLVFNLKITVKDTFAPVVITCDNVYTKPNKPIDYKKGVKFKDNIDQYDVKLEFKEVKPIDYTKTGEYLVEVYAIDKSGNKSQPKVFKVCVTKRTSIIPLVAIVNGVTIAVAGAGTLTIVLLYKRYYKQSLLNKQQEERNNA